MSRAVYRLPALFGRWKLTDLFFSAYAEVIGFIGTLTDGVWSSRITP